MRTLFKDKENYLFGFIFLSGFILRIYRLGNASFWFDESLPLVMTGEGIKKALFPLKFYCPIIWDTFIHYYCGLIKDNALLLRLPAIIFGALSIIVIYRLGALLFNKKTALLSAFILAISPFHIYYSREIRMYSFISFLSLISVYSLVRAIKENKNIYWYSYSIANIANIYIHPMMSLFFLAEVISFIFYIKKYNHLIYKWIKIHFFIFIFLIPWLISILSGLNLVIKKDDWFFELTLSWIPKITWANVFYTFKNFSIGYNAIKEIYLLAVLLFAILFLMGVFKKGKDGEGIVLALLCIFIPILSAYFISRFSNCYLDRYFIPSSLFYYLVAARGLSGLNKTYTSVILAGIVLLSAIALKNYYINYLPGEFEEHIGVRAKKDQEGAAKYVANNFRKGDIILHISRNTIPSFRYYFNKEYKGNAPLINNLIFQWSKDNNKLVPFEYNTDNHKFIDQSNNIILEKQKRIWVVFSAWDFDSVLREPNSVESRMLRWINQNYSLENSKGFPGIIVYLYRNSVS